MKRYCQFITLLLSFGLSAALPSSAEQSASSDAFVDSAGINIHLHYTDTLYYSNFPLVESSLKALAVRHVRDGLVDTTLKAYYDRHNQLGADGIHSIFVTTPTQTAALLQAWPARVSKSFEGFEGPNEYDASGDPNWAATLRAFLPTVYSAGRTLGFPVLGPSFTNTPSFTSFGDASKVSDSGNLHNYSGQRNPGTAGWWGAGYPNYGSIPLAIQLEQNISGVNPIISTELGYNNDPTMAYPIPENASSVYMPRIYLMQWLSGVKRTYIYELLSEHATGEDFGLLRSNGSAKPAFNAVANFLTLLKDPGPAFTPAALDYTITGGDATLKHLLLQKRDGSFYLVLWLESSIYDVNAKTRVTVAAQPLSLHVGHPLQSATAYQLDQAGNMTPAALATTGDLAVSATPAVLIVKLQLSTTNLLTVQVNPPQAGALTYSPASNDNYYDPGKTVTVTATPAPGYVFTGFTGDIASQASPLSVSMSGPRSLVANFDCAYSTAPSSAGVAPTLALPKGAGATAVPVSTGPNCPWAPASSAAWLMVAAPSASKGSGTFTAAYSANTGAARTAQIAVGSAVIAVTQAAQPNVAVRLTTLPAGGKINVDGVVVTTPATVNWFTGSAHTLTTIQPQFVGGAAYLGYGWIPGGSTNVLQVVAPATAAAYQQNLSPAALLTTTITGGGTLLVSPDPALTSGYYLVGHKVGIWATPNKGCTFVGFTGSTAGSTLQGTSTVFLYMTTAKTIAATFNCPVASTKH